MKGCEYVVKHKRERKTYKIREGDWFQSRNQDGWIDRVTVKTGIEAKEAVSMVMDNKFTYRVVRRDQSVEIVVCP